MADESTPLSPKSLADAESFEEFKALASAPKAAPVQQPETEEKPAQPSAEGEQPEETVGDPDTPQSQDEKPEKQHQRKRDAEKRIEQLLKEQREQADKHKAEVERLNRELSEARKTAPAPQRETPPAPETKTEAAGKPKLSDFLKDPANAGKPYEEVHEAWTEAVLDWRDKQRENQQKAKSVQERTNSQAAKSREKYPDFDTVIEAGMPRVLKALAPQAVLAFRDETDNGTDVLYVLASQPAELSRIAALSPLRQVQAVLSLSEQLAKPSEPAAPPEKPSNVRPITRLNPPAKHVLGAGITPAEEKPDPTDPSYERWKQAEAKRTKRA